MKLYALEFVPLRPGNICSPLILHREQNVLPGLPYKLIIKGYSGKRLQRLLRVCPCRTETPNSLWVSLLSG